MGTASGALEAARVVRRRAETTAGKYRSRLRGHLHLRLHPGAALCAVRRAAADGRRSQRGSRRNSRLRCRGGAAAKPGNLLYRKFQARAYQVSNAAGRTVSEIEAQIGRRAVVERILATARTSSRSPDAKLHAGDEILLAGPSAAIVAAAPMIGPEIEGEHVMRSVPGEVVEVYVTARHLHGRTLSEIVDRLGRHGARCFPARVDAAWSGSAGDARTRESMSATS